MDYSPKELQMQLGNKFYTWRLEAGTLNMIWKNISKKLWKDPDPEEISIDNAYKTRWVWYHTILGIELLIVILVQLAILVLLAVKLWR